MKFRRKAQEPVRDVSDDGDDAALDAGPQSDEEQRAEGPYDSDELGHEELERVDLGSLLIAPEAERELRIQVDEGSGVVQSVVLAGPDGALEIRAFAAPRNGDLWGEARPQIAAQVAESGGTTIEREGPFGTELVCEVAQPGGLQVTRVIGVNGPRWMLRASLLGQPAMTPDDSEAWLTTLRRVAVHRGQHAMPVGEALPITMPEQARRVDLPTAMSPHTHG